MAICDGWVTVPDWRSSDRTVGWQPGFFVEWERTRQPRVRLRIADYMGGRGLSMGGGKGGRGGGGGGVIFVFFFFYLSKSNSTCTAGIAHHEYPISREFLSQELEPLLH